MANNALRYIGEFRRPDSQVVDLQLGLRFLPLVLMILVLAGLFLLVLAIGSVHIPLQDILTIITGGEGAKSKPNSAPGGAGFFASAPDVPNGSGAKCLCFVMGAAGIEPATPTMSRA